MGESELGPAVGIGRSADVYALEGGLVLRRYRADAATEYHAELAARVEEEAALMTYALEHGYPVPRVERAEGPDIVMERVDGPTMLADLARRPWMMRTHAATLARLHHQLHAIPAPSWLERRIGEGNDLIHLDLHPDNVLLGANGPVVIDWPNAAAGPGAADVAHTWLVTETATPPGGMAQRIVAAVGRGLFLRSFLGHFDRDEVRQQLPVTAERRLHDRNIGQHERERTERFLAKVGASGP
jgi:aminoglycoside phosphotransferase (APT) family kinase protein